MFEKGGWNYLGFFFNIGKILVKMYLDFKKCYFF